MQRRVGIACAAFSFWLTSACQTSCGVNSNQAAVKYVDGKTHLEGPLRIYESTPVHGEWLYFPGNRRFLLEHNLHTTNYNTFMYVAFSSHPLPGDAAVDTAGNAAVASGDVAIVEQVNEDSIQLRNDTCSEQYLYVKLTVPVDSDAGSSD